MKQKRPKSTLLADNTRGLFHPPPPQDPRPLAQSAESTHSVPPSDIMALEEEFVLVRGVGCFFFWYY